MCRAKITAPARNSNTAIATPTLIPTFAPVDKLLGDTVVVDTGLVCGIDFVVAVDVGFVVAVAICKVLRDRAATED